MTGRSYPRARPTFDAWGLPRADGGGSKLWKARSGTRAYSHAQIFQRRRNQESNGHRGRLEVWTDRTGHRARSGTFAPSKLGFRKRGGGRAKVCGFDLVTGRAMQAC